MNSLNTSAWESPKLIVLVRKSPEEMVLESCKNMTYPGVQNEGTMYQGCSKNVGYCDANCDTLGDS